RSKTRSSRRRVLIYLEPVFGYISTQWTTSTMSLLIGSGTCLALHIARSAGTNLSSTKLSH
ncbi:MAG TPA: hypothetical protein VFR80_03350, partial [Pyrinomonadaceae bacterium]|nr:hypothetical protein [Pyrinomonadaceae bacterium]